MHNRLALIVVLVLAAACSGGSEPLPIQDSATLQYEVVVSGLGSDTVLVTHEFHRQADGGFVIRRHVEDDDEGKEMSEPVYCDEFGIDPEGDPHGMFLAAKAPIFMPASARRADARFHGFRVKQELEWNGHPAVEVAGRDGWTWYYSTGTGLFLGGQFVISAGGFRVKLVRSEGFGTP